MSNIKNLIIKNFNTKEEGKEILNYIDLNYSGKDAILYIEAFSKFAKNSTKAFIIVTPNIKNCKNITTIFENKEIEFLKTNPIYVDNGKIMNYLKKDICPETYVISEMKNNPLNIFIDGIYNIEKFVTFSAKVNRDNTYESYMFFIDKNCKKETILVIE